MSLVPEMSDEKFSLFVQPTFNASVLQGMSELLSPFLSFLCIACIIPWLCYWDQTLRIFYRRFRLGLRLKLTIACTIPLELFWASYHATALRDLSA